MIDCLQKKFVRTLCEDCTKHELRSQEFNWKKIRNLPGFPKNERIKTLHLCLISSNFILLKGDDDILLVLKDDGKDVYVERWEIVEAIFLPSLDDEDALEYFSECCIDEMFSDDE